MKLVQKNNEDDIELDMSPMIDMVFLLLIFFIVASQIIDEKPQVEIPDSVYAKVPDEITGRLMITVRADERYFIGQVEVSFDEMKEKLALEIKKDPNMRVLIRSDAQTKYKVNEKVMTACAEIGANDLIYSAFEE